LGSAAKTRTGWEAPAATGNAIEVAALSVHRVEDGRIAETWTVWDTLGFMQQIGAVPAEAASAG
jgi:hypothetical protein